MLDAKNAFAAAYRAARLIPHKFACAAATKALDEQALTAFPAAVNCWAFRREKPYSVDAARCAAANGYSFKTAIRLHLRSARRRRWMRSAA